MKVLFVCTGNTCRSPMGEGILRDIAKKRNLDIQVKSAGLSVYDGDLAAENSKDAMAKIGIDISNHKSSQIHRDLIDESDLILTMSNTHKEAILSNFEASKSKVFTLLEYAYGVDKDIKDPYGRSLEIYENTRDEIYEAIIEMDIVNKGRKDI